MWLCRIQGQDHGTRVDYSCSKAPTGNTMYAQQGERCWCRTIVFSAGVFLDPYLQDKCRMKPHNQSKDRMRSLRNHSPYRSNMRSHHQCKGGQIIKASLSPDC